MEFEEVFGSMELSLNQYRTTKGAGIVSSCVHVLLCFFCSSMPECYALFESVIKPFYVFYIRGHHNISRTTLARVGFEPMIPVCTQSKTAHALP